MIIKNDRNIDDQNTSWDYYLREINAIDSFKTRYYHYLRWRSVNQYLDTYYNNKKHVSGVALDIGCNRGYYSAKLGDLGFKVDAVDLHLDSCQLIPNQNVTYFEGNFLNWTPPRKYDLILLFEVYEHIPPDERETFIRKVVSVLNPGGILLFSGPNCISLYYGAGYFKYSIKKTFGYIEEIDWHYRIPCLYYNHIFTYQNLIIKKWDTNGVFPVLSNNLERLLNFKKNKFIIPLDIVLSKIFKGFGANYIAVLKKEDILER